MFDWLAVWQRNKMVFRPDFIIADRCVKTPVITKVQLDGLGMAAAVLICYFHYKQIIFLFCCKVCNTITFLQLLQEIAGPPVNNQIIIVFFAAAIWNCKIFA